MGITGTVEEFKTPSVITDYSGTVTGRDGSQGDGASWMSGNGYARINMKLYSGAFAIGRLTNAVNLTGWNYIDCIFGVGKYISEAFFGISQNPNLSNVSLTNSIRIADGITQNIKLNVSANNGVWYIYLAIRNGSAGSNNGAIVRDIKLMTQ